MASSVRRRSNGGADQQSAKQRRSRRGHGEEERRWSRQSSSQARRAVVGGDSVLLGSVGGGWIEEEKQGIVEGPPPATPPPNTAAALPGKQRGEDRCPHASSDVEPRRGDEDTACLDGTSNTATHHRRVAPCCIAKLPLAMRWPNGRGWRRCQARQGAPPPSRRCSAPSRPRRKRRDRSGRPWIRNGSSERRRAAVGCDGHRRQQRNVASSPPRFSWSALELRSVKQRHRATAMAVSGVGVSMAVVSSDLQQQRPVYTAMRHAAATKQSHGGGGLWCHRPPPTKAAQRRQTYGLSPLLRFEEAE
nr:hypothetical protein Iba_chr10bCG8800 [Ipomoea batatas]